MNAISDHKDKVTALHIAAQLGLVSKVQWLLKAGANPDILDGQGRNALMAAATHIGDNHQVIRMLQKAGCDITWEQFQSFCHFESRL